MADEFYSPNQRTAPRQSTPGLQLWALRKGARQIVCELRDHEALGAGVEVQLLTDGQFYAGRRLSNLTSAMHHAGELRADLERDGWAV